MLLRIFQMLASQGCLERQGKGWKNPTELFAFAMNAAAHPADAYIGFERQEKQGEPVSDIFEWILTVSIIVFFYFCVIITFNNNIIQ